MATFFNEVMSSKDYINKISNLNIPSDISLDDFDDLRSSDESLAEHWDYGIAEVGYILASDIHAMDNFALVRFSGDIYRFCEL